MLFPTEQSYIDYIRNYYKSTIFNIIKARYLDKTNSYIIVYEILENLDNIYDEFNAYKTVFATLYSTDFNI